MNNTNPVKILGALALVLLVFSVTDGWIMSKCELKAKLDAAQFQQITAMGEKIPINNLIARLVCMANSTAFNTSFIKVITGNKQQKRSAPAQAPSKAPPHAPLSKSPPHDASKAPPHAPLSKSPPHDASKSPSHDASKAPPHAPSSKAPPHNESEASSHDTSKAPPHAPPPKAPPHDASKAPPSRVPPQVPSSRAPPKNNQEGPRAAQGVRNETQHLPPTAAAQAMERRYGVFQLSDRLACDSGLVPSRNLCKISCNALIDDDITNDIACLKTLMNSTAETLLVKECRSVVPDKLFANCA